jgi:microsomal dipeptidase-like Zn-dependent dipeptidase
VGGRALLFIYMTALSLACGHAPGGELKTDQTKETRAPEARSDAAKPERAGAHDPASVHRRAVVIDMHADTVQFMLDEGADINQRLTTTHLDAVRMREGGLDAQFFSIWVEPEFRALIAEASRNARGGPSLKRIARDRVREREYAARLPAVPLARVVDHIDHIVRLVGVEHVGVGSDFDGIQATPAGLSSVADLPNLTAELLRRGYTEDDVTKILGGNILRVMEEVERVEGR